MLGVVVAQVLGSWTPVDDELALLGSILNPVKANVDRLLPLLLDGIIGKTNSRGVVNLHGSWRLGMVHFLQGRANWHGLLAIYIGSAYLGLGGGSHDIAKDLGQNVDGTIGLTICWVGRVGGK